MILAVLCPNIEHRKSKPKSCKDGINCFIIAACFTDNKENTDLRQSGASPYNIIVYMEDGARFPHFALPADNEVAVNLFRALANL